MTRDKSVNDKICTFLMLSKLFMMLTSIDKALKADPINLLNLSEQLEGIKKFIVNLFSWIVMSSAEPRIVYVMRITWGTTMSLIYDFLADSARLCRVYLKKVINKSQNQLNSKANKITKHDTRQAFMIKVQFNQQMFRLNFGWFCFQIKKNQLSRLLKRFNLESLLSKQEKKKSQFDFEETLIRKPASRILKTLFFFMKVCWMLNIDFVVSDISHIKATWSGGDKLLILFMMLLTRCALELVLT